MSGGRWDYEHKKLGEIAEHLREVNDPVADLLATHLEELEKVIESLDLRLSGDSSFWYKRNEALRLCQGSLDTHARKRLSALRDLIQTVLPEGS